MKKLQVLRTPTGKMQYSQVQTVKDDIYNIIEGITGNKTAGRAAMDKVEFYLSVYGDTKFMYDKMIKNYT